METVPSYKTQTLAKKDMKHVIYERIIGLIVIDE